MNIYILMYDIWHLAACVCGLLYVMCIFITALAVRSFSSSNSQGGRGSSKDRKL